MWTPQDFVWIEEVSSVSGDATWTYLDSAGTWQRLLYRRRDRVVLGRQLSRFSDERRQLVVRLVADGGFFSLNSLYPQPDTPVEGDILVVACRHGSRYHRVVSRPPDDVPLVCASLRDVVQTPDAPVQDSEPAPGYWRVDTVDPNRARRVLRRGMLPVRDVQSGGDALPLSLKQAVSSPGIWVPIPRNEMDESEEVSRRLDTLLLVGGTASWMAERWQSAASAST